MAKRIKASKLKKEEEEENLKTSINNVYEAKEEDEAVSVNNALEEEEAANELDEAAILEAYMADETEATEEEETATMEMEEEAMKTEEIVEEETMEEETEVIEVDPIEIKQKIAEETAKSQGLNLPAAEQKRDPKKDKDPIEGEDLGLVENDFLLSRKVSKEDFDLHANVNEEALLGSNERKPKDFLNVFQRGPSTKNQPKVDTSADIENNAVVQKEIAAKQVLRNYHSNDSSEKGNALNIFKELKLDKDIIKEIKEDKRAHQNQNLIEIIRELL